MDIKIILIVIIILIVSLIFWKFYNINENFYIRPEGGLCNKLRVLLAHSTIHNHIYVYWPNEDNCPGTFTDVFEPIEGVTFVSEQSKYDYKGYNNFQHILNKHYITDDDNRLQKQSLKQLKPIPLLRQIINDFIIQYNIRNGIALHIRRTDMNNHTKTVLNIPTISDQAFFDFIDNLPHYLPIFLATDNQTTQEIMRNRYPNRLIMYKPIIGDTLTNKRLTTLEHSVIDMFIAKEAKYFKGTNGSSFTETIILLRDEI